MKYKITKTFTGGLLNGITVIEAVNNNYLVGYECKNPVGNSSPYIITNVKEIGA